LKVLEQTMHLGLKPCQFRQVDAHGRILCNLIKGGDREVSVNLCRACPVAQINCQHLRAGLQKHTSTPITVKFATGRVEVWDDQPPTIEFKQAACAAKTMPIHSARDCAGCPIRLPNIIPQNAIQVAHRAKVSQPPPPALPQPSAARPVGTSARAPRTSAEVAPRAAQSTRVEQPVALEIGGAAALIARAKETAALKARERALAEEQQSYEAQPTEGKSKIIQLQEWLAGQLNRKQAHQPLVVQPDADGVSDIVYAPLGGITTQSYQETADYERCVGWTD
jgi:hypothetical protein